MYRQVTAISCNCIFLRDLTVFLRAIRQYFCICWHISVNVFLHMFRQVPVIICNCISVCDLTVLLYVVTRFYQCWHAFPQMFRRASVFVCMLYLYSSLCFTGMSAHVCVVRVFLHISVLFLYVCTFLRFTCISARFCIVLVCLHISVLAVLYLYLSVLY